MGSTAKGADSAPMQGQTVRDCDSDCGNLRYRIRICIAPNINTTKQILPGQIRGVPLLTPLCPIHFRIPSLHARMSSSTEVEAASKPHPLDANIFDGGLFKDEFVWRNHQPWLAESGYMLRPRYRLDWEPSWLKSKKNFAFCEDGRSPLVSVIPARYHCVLQCPTGDNDYGCRSYFRRTCRRSKAGPQVEIPRRRGAQPLFDHVGTAG